MQAAEFLDRTSIEFSVSNDRYSITETTDPPEARSAFAIVNRAGTFTVVKKEEHPGGGSHRIITFEADLPNDLTGFLAIVSEALAVAQVPIFVVSSFRTDHVLVREDDVRRARNALASTGFKERKEPKND